jgi:hypothetical protein
MVQPAYTCTILITCFVLARLASLLLDWSMHDMHAREHPVMIVEETAHGRSMHLIR